MDGVEAKRCTFVVLVLIRDMMTLRYIYPRKVATSEE